MSYISHTIILSWWRGIFALEFSFICHCLISFNSSTHMEFGEIFLYFINQHSVDNFSWKKNNKHFGWFVHSFYFFLSYEDKRQRLERIKKLKTDYAERFESAINNMPLLLIKCENSSTVILYICVGFYNPLLLQNQTNNW